MVIPFRESPFSSLDMDHARGCKCYAWAFLADSGAAVIDDRYLPIASYKNPLKVYMM